MSAQIISFNCILKNKAGRTISSTFNRDVLNTTLADSPQLPALAKALQNLEAGEFRTVNLSAEEAYGLYDPKKVILFPRKKLPKNTTTGMTIHVRNKEGRIDTYKVKSVKSEFVQLDGNHPLAGQDLIFEIEAITVRPASLKELEDSLSPTTDKNLH